MAALTQHVSAGGTGVRRRWAHQQLLISSCPWHSRSGPQACQYKSCHRAQAVQARHAAWQADGCAVQRSWLLSACTVTACLLNLWPAPAPAAASEFVAAQGYQLQVPAMHCAVQPTLPALMCPACAPPGASGLGKSRQGGGRQPVGGSHAQVGSRSPRCRSCALAWASSCPLFLQEQQPGRDCVPGALFGL
jgi:hypothetical protein